MKKIVGFFIVLIFLITPLSVFAATYQTQNDVEIQGDIPICNLNIIVKPEKRIPPVNNWGTVLRIQIKTPIGADVAFFQQNSNYQGLTTLDLCGTNVFLKPQNYNFLVWGESHLKKLFKNIYIGDTFTSSIDLSGSGQRLLAGETSNVYDNKINSLDISTQISNLYTSNYKNDLNQDGKVNSLDISNTIANFYLMGDQ